MEMKQCINLLFMEIGWIVSGTIVWNKYNMLHGISTCVYHTISQKEILCYIWEETREGIGGKE